MSLLCGRGGGESGEGREVRDGGGREGREAPSSPLLPPVGGRGVTDRAQGGDRHSTVTAVLPPEVRGLGEGEEGWGKGARCTLHTA